MSEKDNKRIHPVRKIVLLCMVFILLPIIQILIYILPFRWIVVLFRLTPCEAEPCFISTASSIALTQVEWAVRKSLQYLPARFARCLAQALTARLILGNRNSDTALFLGVYYQKQNMNAHAWLAHGDKIITGHTNTNDFTQVAVFQ